MPLFDFKCATCGTVFEDYSSYDADHELVVAVSCACGGMGERIWITAPGIATDGNLTPAERTASLLKFGKDPESRAELSRLKAQHGDLPVGKEDLVASSEKKKTEFRLSEQQKREAIQMVEANRAKARHDEWRMQYTQDPQVKKAAAEAAKELSNGSR